MFPLIFLVLLFTLTIVSIGTFITLIIIELLRMFGRVLEQSPFNRPLY